MAEGTATDSRYEVAIEEVGAAKKRLTITVPAEVINEKIADSMGTLATRTALPGFRKGRAPKALLERRFGPTVRDETRSQVIADGYSSAIEEHKIKPVGDPEPVTPFDELELEIGKPLTFAVEVEVVPEFDLPDLEGIEVKKPVMEVTDEHLDEELRRQCAQIGELVAVKDDFQTGDRLVGPGKATKEGEDEPFFTHDNVDFIVPAAGDRGAVLGLLIDGLDDLVNGKSIGDTVHVEATGPDGHELEHIRGARLTIEVTLRDGMRIIPAPVEKVLEQYGMDSEEILREQIKLALEQRRNEEQRGAMREQVYDLLDEKIDFELPEKLSAGQAERLLEHQRLEMLYRGGLSADEVEQRLAEIREETEAQSRRRLKLSFVLHRLAEQFEVSVTDQEINGRIAAIAAQRGERPDKLRTELVQAGRIGQIAVQIRDHKTADRVIDKANVTEVAAAEWNEIMREKRRPTGAEAATKKKKTTTKKKKSTKKKTSSAKPSDEAAS